MSAHYTLFGFALPEDVVRSAEDGVVVMQEDGEPLARWRTEQVKHPRRCWCGRGVGPMSSCGCCCTEHDRPWGDS